MDSAARALRALHASTLEGGIDMMPTNVPDATEAQRNLLRSEAFPADEISERLRESG